MVINGYDYPCLPHGCCSVAEDLVKEVAYYKQLSEAYQMISIGIQSHQMNKVAYGYSQIEALQKSPGAPVETPAQIAFKQRKPELLKALDEIKEFLKNG